MTPKTYVFFGNVGAGKGTQVDLLKNLLEQDSSQKVIHAATGNEYRALIGGPSYSGVLVKEILNRGHLLPNFLTISVFTSILVRELTPEAHLIADGYPRTVAQSEAFISAMEFYKRTDIEIVYIEVSKDEVIKRMKLRARDDDTDEGIARRFYEYETNVLPAMKTLQERGYNLHTINGAQTVGEVHTDIKKALRL